MKARNRDAMLERFHQTRELEGVFKDWVSPLVLYEGLGRIESVKKHPIYPYLRHDGPRPPDEDFVMKQCTKIYKPQGCYRAPIP